MKSLSFSSELIPAVLDDRKTQTRRVMKPQPPSIEAVDALAGSGGFSIFTDRHSESPAHFRVGGPVWAVRQLIGEPANSGWVCPYGAPGERLWVRETHYRFGHWERKSSPSKKTGCYGYRFIADTDEVCFSDAAPDTFRVTPSRESTNRAKPQWYRRLARFMPRVLSRATLELTGVRVERLQDISERDARAEGVERDTEACDHTRRSCEDVGCLGPGYRAPFADLWNHINGDGAWKTNPWVWVVEFARVTP